jgi:threonine synthase
VRYDLKKVKRTFRKKALISRSENLWRYRELLPVNKEENIVSLGEGMTPLIHLKKSGPKLGVNHLYLKDEGLIPT